MASSSCVLTETHRLAAPEQLISELTRGREIADRLRFLLRETGFDGSPGSVFPAQTLVNQLLDTFTHSLTMLLDGADSDEVSQVPSAAKSEDSGDSCKTPPPPAKDRRGCYKRKRNSETWIKDSPNLFEDGHAWRKYGQKVILNAKHPRNYFRCTHKFDQGCQASKQVQRIEDNPPLYRTTYNGHHTCNNVFKSATHHIVPSAPDSSVIWNFDTANLLVDSAPQIKQEPMERLPEEYYISPDLTAFHHHLPSASDMSSDVYSCTASTHTIQDMDAIVGSIEDFFEFETIS